MDPSAIRLEEWMTDHGPAVLGLARRLLCDRHAAEDVFQATFTKAFCRVMPFRDCGHTRAWLLRVAANECISRLRGTWRRRVSLMACPPGSGQGEPATGGLVDALNRLAPHYREVVWLHYYAGYDTKEIAGLTGLPAATVRTRLRRAREKLKGLLDGGGPYEIP